MKKKNNKRGFTLIELLVVIAIIGLLSTLAVIALSKARQKARDAKRQSDAKVLQTAVEMYATDNGNPPSIDDINTYATNNSVALWDALGGVLKDQLPQGIPHDPGSKIWCYCNKDAKYLIAVGLETDNSVPGDLDATTLSSYTPSTDCICGGTTAVTGAAATTINCADGGAGEISAGGTDQNNETVFCLGSI